MTDPKNTVQSLGRGLEVLTALADGELSVTDVGQRLGVDKSTAYRLMSTLESFAFVSQNPRNRKYRLGLGCLKLAGSVLRDLDLRAVARPYLEQLCAESSETVFLGVLEGRGVVYADRVLSPSPLAVTSDVGGRAPLNATATAKAILAWLPEERNSALCRMEPLRPFTMRTITNPDILAIHLREVQERGYAVDDEEFCIGLRCVACPVFDSAGAVVGSLSVSGPVHRMTPERVPAIGRRTMELAERLSRELGFAGRRPAGTGAAAPLR